MVNITRKVAVPSAAAGKNNTARWAVFTGIKDRTQIGSFQNGAFSFHPSAGFDTKLTFFGDKWTDVKTQIEAHITCVNVKRGEGFEDGFHGLQRRYSDADFHNDDLRKAYTEGFQSGDDYRTKRQHEIDRQFKIGLMWSDGTASSTQLWDVSREQAWALIEKWMTDDIDGGRKMARGVTPVSAVVTKIEDDSDSEVRHYVGASAATPTMITKTNGGKRLSTDDVVAYVVLARNKGGRWGWAGAHPSRERANQDVAWLKTVVKAEADMFIGTVEAAFEECMRRNA